MKIMKKILFLGLLLCGTFVAQAQQIETENAVIDLGQVVFRHPVTAEYEIKNTAGIPISIDNVRTSCGCTEVEYPQQGIEVGQSFMVRATYDAKQMGHFSKQIGIYTDGSKQPLMLTLKGVVVEEIVDFGGDYAFQLGDLLADKNTIEFDDVNRGDRPYQKIHVKNPTSDNVQPQVMHLPAYLKADVSPSKIAPGHEGVITINLDSRQLNDDGLTQTEIFLGKNPGDKTAASKAIDVSVVLLPAFRDLTADDLAFAPHVHLSTTKLDLGSFDKKKKLKGEIFIMNTGKSPLHISNLQLFSEGLELSLKKTTIEPEEVVALKVTARAKEYKAAKSKPRVLMITDDPDQPKVVIEIIAQ